MEILMLRVTVVLAACVCTPGGDSGFCDMAWASSYMHARRGLCCIWWDWWVVVFGRHVWLSSGTFGLGVVMSLDLYGYRS